MRIPIFTKKAAPACIKLLNILAEKVRKLCGHYVVLANCSGCLPHFDPLPLSFMGSAATVQNQSDICLAACQIGTGRLIQILRGIPGAYSCIRRNVALTSVKTDINL